MDKLDSCDDAGLLTRYAREGDQSAFALLIERRVSLVYATARRVLGSTLGADDGTQVVFVELAQAAKKYDPKIPVVAWLCAAARNRALNVVRGETRRLAREQAAHALSMIDANEPNWVQVEPVLDEAMDELPPQERSAVWLRFFEGKGLREVGAELGISEDAAQKRVTRALEQLRELLGKRGVKLTSAGLATGLTAQAATMASAPVGLASAITAAVGGLATTVAGVGLGAAAKTLVMTTIQKAALGGAAAVLVGVAIFEWTTLQSCRDELARLREESGAMTQQVKQRESAVSLGQSDISKLDAEIDAKLAVPKPGSDEALEAQMLAWIGRRDRLQKIAREHPEWVIPEMAALSNEAWMEVARDARFGETDDLRRSMARLRRSAEELFVGKLQRMVRVYGKSNGAASSSGILQLAPYADPSLTPAILDRYEVLPGSPLSIAPRKIVDLEYDHYVTITATRSSRVPAMEVNLSEGWLAYQEAHAGYATKRLDQVLPYLKWPTDLVTLERYTKRKGGALQTAGKP